MKVLITGASGFVGKNLTSYLKAGFGLKYLSRDELKTSSPSMLNNCDAIVHLAGKAHDLKNVSAPAEYYNVNFELTKSLYDSFLISNCSKFIFISTVKAVADCTDEPLTENIEPKPETHYGKSKLMAEEYIKAQPLPAGKSYYILRPCMIHGPGNKGNLNLLFKLVSKGIPYPLAGFNNMRSFLSVENLCFVIEQLISRNDVPCGIYQVADDDALSTNQVVATLAHSINKKPRLWKISASLIGFLAKAGDKLHLPLTTERLAKLTENYVVDNNKIRRALGSELPVTAVAGLTATARSFAKK